MLCDRLPDKRRPKQVCADDGLSIEGIQQHGPEFSRNQLATGILSMFFGFRAMRARGHKGTDGTPDTMPR